MRARKSSLLCVLAVMAVPAMAQDIPLPGPRPFDQMRGTCGDFAMDIRQETAAWAAGQTAEQIEASATEDDSPMIAARQLTRLILRPHEEVSFRIPPEQDRGAPEKFSGHARVTIPEPGLWRIAASNGLWFDAVSDGAIVPTGAFEMQTQCKGPFKIVVFDLPAGDVALQFNGSPTAQVEVIVLPWVGP